MTPAIQEKHALFLHLLEKVLLPETAVGISRIATGHVRLDSDIATNLFLQSNNLFIVPAEAVWLAADNSYPNIFSQDEAIQPGLQLD